MLRKIYENNISRKRNISIESPSHNYFQVNELLYITINAISKIIILILSHDSKNLENSEYKDLKYVA